MKIVPSSIELRANWYASPDEIATIFSHWQDIRSGLCREEIFIGLWESEGRNIRWSMSHKMKLKLWRAVGIKVKRGGRERDEEENWFAEKVRWYPRVLRMLHQGGNGSRTRCFRSKFLIVPRKSERLVDYKHTGNFWWDQGERPFVEQSIDTRVVRK